MGSRLLVQSSLFERLSHRSGKFKLWKEYCYYSGGIKGFGRRSSSASPHINNGGQQKGGVKQPAVSSCFSFTGHSVSDCAGSRSMGTWPEKVTCAVLSATDLLSCTCTVLKTPHAPVPPAGTTTCELETFFFLLSEERSIEQRLGGWRARTHLTGHAPALLSHTLSDASF